MDVIVILLLSSETGNIYPQYMSKQITFRLCSLNEECNIHEKYKLNLNGIDARSSAKVATLEWLELFIKKFEYFKKSEFARIQIFSKKKANIRFCNGWGPTWPCSPSCWEARVRGRLTAEVPAMGKVEPNCLNSNLTNTECSSKIINFYFFKRSHELIR